MTTTATRSARSRHPRGVLSAINGLFARIRRCRRGGVAVEFAMSMPVLILIVLGGVEIARYALLNQKLSRLSLAMSDLVAQSENIAESDFTQLFGATGLIMAPFALGGDGIVILSSVNATGGTPPVVAWQRAGGGGLTGAASTLGTEGNTATLPTGFIVRDGESVIVAEVFYNFSPLMTGNYVTASSLYNRAMFRPRFGALAAVAP